MGNNTIFWADDDPEDLEICRSALEEITDRYRMIAFKNGMQLLQYLFALPSESFPSLIVLDINMPILNGKETLIFLKTDPHYQAIPVAMFTTSNAATDRHFCMQYDAPMFTKPSSLDAVNSVIHKLLEHIGTSAGNSPVPD